jgi:hypothetical protein
MSLAADGRRRHDRCVTRRAGYRAGRRRWSIGEERTVADRDIEIQSGIVGAGGFPGDTSPTGGLRPPSAAGAGSADAEGATDDEADGTGTIHGGVPGGGSGAGGGPGTVSGARGGESSEAGGRRTDGGANS